MMSVCEVTGAGFIRSDFVRWNLVRCAEENIKALKCQRPRIQCAASGPERLLESDHTRIMSKCNYYTRNPLASVIFLPQNGLKDNAFLCIWAPEGYHSHDGVRAPQQSKVVQGPVPSCLEQVKYMRRWAMRKHRFTMGPGWLLDQDNLVDSGAWVEVKSGDISRIQGEPGQKRFGEVTKASGTKLLVCKNNTDARANISIGDGYSQRYEPTLIWTGVGLPAVPDLTLRLNLLQT
ncbi:hypothetical protein AG1IA_03113 [Rhizoctonia solani AG-1 IA]|uniref:Uncharacterized protein n=1 Tax=Thanatephorus cucumeris (strain AG1-IA) TaxID=983506 RepID=L8X1H6_THACA|nr:hypothetical protein AG1IA_03113 [Rhizoctonia solani AG-1 IA]